MTTTKARERGIIFDAESVAAILAGEKSMTRRVIPPAWWVWLDPEDEDDLAKALPQCPYGQPGDRLWVRETLEAGALPGLLIAVPDLRHPIATYAADGAPVREANGFDVAPWWKGRRQPALYMPRWASRITLEIVAIRVERVREIAALGALAEGVRPEPGETAVAAFARRWDAINARRGYPWASNPHVWAITFRRVE